MGDKMNPEKYFEEPITVYQCGNCYEEYETKSEAKKCCAMWICGECGNDFVSKSEANKCCKGA